MDIDESRVERALVFLRDTAEEYGEITGEVIYLREKLKTVEAIEFEKVEKGGETSKRMAAKASKAYQEAMKELRDAEAQMITLRAKREAADKMISWSQTKIKAKLQGVVI